MPSCVFCASGLLNITLCLPLCSLSMSQHNHIPLQGRTEKKEMEVKQKLYWRRQLKFLFGGFSLLLSNILTVGCPASLFQGQTWLTAVSNFASLCSVIQKYNLKCKSITISTDWLRCASRGCFSLENLCNSPSVNAGTQHSWQDQACSSLNASFLIWKCALAFIKVINVL